MEKLKTGNKNRKPAGYNKRTEEQRAYDIAYCSNLFLRGYTYREITEALNRDLSDRGVGYTITLSMVYYDLQQTLIEWKRERLDNIDDYVTQELRKLDAMEVQAWEAWEASKTGKMRTKEKTNKGRPIKTDAEDSDPEYYGYNETATETSAGNPRFLDLLLNIQQRRRHSCRALPRALSWQCSPPAAGSMRRSSRQSCPDGWPGQPPGCPRRGQGA